MDIKKEKVSANAIELGMFVAELDKPWMESDFLIQGFVIEDQEDLNKIRSTCEFIIIDRTKSVGNQFAAKGKRNVAIKRKPTVRIKAPTKPNKNTPVMNKARQGERVSFMDVLREVKNYQAVKNSSGSTEDGTVFNARSGSDDSSTSNPELPLADENTENNQPQQESAGILSSIGGMFGGLFGKKEKLKTTVEIEYDKSFLDGFTEEERIIYEQETPVEEEIAHIYPIYEESQVVTRDIFDAIATENEVDISGVSDVLDNMVESIGRTPDALMGLAKLKKADGEAYNLALNVSVTLMAFNSFLALPKEQVKLSGLAGLLQDIGKVKLSSDVLLKKGKLTKEEFQYAQKHVDESLRILRETPDIPEEVLSIVAQHHERADGSGYPNQLKESQLSLLAQSAGLIDTYCAMTNNRAYAEGAYHQKALDNIHELSANWLK